MKFIRWLICIIGPMLLCSIPAKAEFASQYDKYQAVEKVAPKQARKAPRAVRHAIKDKRWVKPRKTTKIAVAPPLAKPGPIRPKVPEIQPEAPNFLDFLADLGEKLENPQDDYLCRVYHRVHVMADSGGDFSWKDKSAAKRAKMGLCQYVILGMHPQLRQNLYAAGQAMDQAGIRWSMSSAFRDNYRQHIASGFKAGDCTSQHGGTCVTKGHGDGRAVDVIGAEANHGAVWSWLDKNGRKYGLYRSMPGADPPHLQANNLSVPIVAKTRVAEHRKRRHAKT